MRVPVWYDDTSVGDGIDETIGEEWSGLLELAHVAPSLPGISYLEVDRDEVRLAGQVGPFVGQPPFPLVMVHCGDLAVFAECPVREGWVVGSGRLWVETFGDRFGNFELAFSYAASGRVARLEMVELRHSEETATRVEGARYPIETVRPQYFTRNPVSIYDCAVLAHVDLDADVPTRPAR
ncbi:MAG: hypothetical protein ABIP21_12115 [Acidimicrobiia bacterium]